MQAAAQQCDNAEVPREASSLDSPLRFAPLYKDAGLSHICCETALISVLKVVILAIIVGKINVIRLDHGHEGVCQVKRR